jgi:hypothetical protein
MYECGGTAPRILDLVSVQQTSPSAHMPPRRSVKDAALVCLDEGTKKEVATYAENSFNWSTDSVEMSPTWDAASCAVSWEPGSLFYYLTEYSKLNATQIRIIWIS